MPAYYDYDPATTKWRLREEGTPVLADLTDLTGGRYSVIGGQIMDRESREPAVATLDPLDSHTLVVDEQGNYWLHQETDATKINTMSKGHISWKGVASGTVTLPTGHSLTLDNQVFAITKFNRQLWVKDIPSPGPRDFLHVNVNRETGDPLERVPRNYRPATAEEASTYGLAGLIASRHKSIVQAAVSAARRKRK